MTNGYSFMNHFSTFEWFVTFYDQLKCDWDRPERYRRMVYYMPTLNSSCPACMKPVLCHSEKSAMSLYMSRNDLLHEQAAYAKSAMLSMISGESLA